MSPQIPEKLNVLLFRGDAATIDKVRAVAPDRLNITDMSAEFKDEIEREWPGRMGQRGGDGAQGKYSDEERERLVREAHVMFMALPFPKTLPGRAPNLIWAHFPFAGVSNMMGSDWWGFEGPMITSSRGATNALPIAETTLAAALMMAKKLDLAVRLSAAGDVSRGADFSGMKTIEGKTMAIVGLGGIGGHLARMSKGVGMRVVATRRSAESRQKDVDGVDELFPTSMQNEMLAEADYVAVCAMWTPETQGMIDVAAFEAMKPGAIILNVARGEIIDEEAMVGALDSGRLGGAYLDVWYNDMGGSPPRPELLGRDNVIFTPHVSGRGDVSHAFAADVFVENLKHLLAGEPLKNVIEWERGY